MKDAVAQVSQVRAAALTSDHIANAMLNIVRGRSSPEKAVRALITPDILAAIQLEGEDKFKERLRSPGHVQVLP
jgi:hypothetical protein